MTGMLSLSSFSIGQKSMHIGSTALASTVMAGLCLLASPAAHAAGTLAGTNIDNIATASYDVGGNTVDIQSNTVTIMVDELLDVTVTSTDPGDVTTSNGATNVVSTFRITNTGNGPESFTLTPNTANGGDDFDPTLAQVVIDNGNGVYDPGVDTIYVAGSNNPALTPDQSITIFVLTNIPTGQADGNRAAVQLIAAATTGTGTPGTTFAGAGEGGSNAVVGTTGADADALGFLLVEAATIALTKSATVADPFGGTTSVPGSVITYQLVATVSGTGTLSNIVISDPIPAGSQYVAGSMTLQAATLTDAGDADQGNFNGSRISVALGNVPAGQTRTVTFRVRVQ
jgi:uncharacterized repeat protein (TIGR01451 family)